MTVALKAPLPRPRTADLARRLNLGVVIFAVLFAAVALKQPSYVEPAGFLNFLRRAAPLAILACGQVFVIVSGGFDLSAGSVVTLTVIGASMMTGGDPAATWAARWRRIRRSRGVWACCPRARTTRCSTSTPTASVGGSERTAQSRTFSPSPCSR